MASKIRSTRYPGLGYTEVGNNDWRFVDLHDPGREACVGEHYKSKGELLADLDRYARTWGYGESEFCASKTLLLATARAVRHPDLWDVYFHVDTEHHVTVEFRLKSQPGMYAMPAPAWQVTSTSEQSAFEPLLKAMDQIDSCAEMTAH